MKSHRLNSRLLATVVPVIMLAPASVVAQAGGTGGQGQVQGQAQGRAQGQVRTPQSRIDATIAAAAEASIPVELIRSKVAEGEAKRVPPERIAAAVEARFTSLKRASETMQRADLKFQSAGELAVTADALDAGVSEGTVIRVSRESAPERRTVAIAVLADLVRLGSSSDRALVRVSAALASTTALANLEAEVSSQLRLGGLTSTLDAAGIIRIP